jgi:serine/threonine-protein kinase
MPSKASIPMHTLANLLASVEDLIANPRYRPLERLGAGGMAEVYLVEHTTLGRRMALKLMRENLATRSDAAELAERMRLEAQAAARLIHRNVVAVTDFWVPGHGRPCIVMEYLQGRTVAERLAAQGRLDVADAIGHACELASALDAAHSLGIVHRDIKPDNLFLDETSRRKPVLKVLDFGVARILRQESRRTPDPLRSATRSGAIVGTPYFMSPEAARGQRVDERADIYAVGLCLYMMLIGHGPGNFLTLQTGPTAEAEPPSKYRPDMPPELDGMVLRALRTDRAERHQSAAELLADLRSLLPRRRSPFA